MKQQGEDGRETLSLTVLAHETHAEEDVIFGWQMNPRTGNLFHSKGLSAIFFWLPIRMNKIE